MTVKAAPVTKFHNIEMGSNTKALPASNISDLSLIDIFFHADIVVKFIILLLILTPIYSVSIIIEKLYFLKSMKNKMNKFEHLLWQENFITTSFSNKLGKFKTNNPLVEIFNAALKEWEIIKKLYGDNIFQTDHIQIVKERLINSMTIAFSDSFEKVEHRTSFLATIASSAPFIGLFGIVWVIMTSFQSKAATKNTTIAVVAPGIAEALLATAIGLAAAIPAAIFYNKFTADSSKLSSKAENFMIRVYKKIMEELYITQLKNK